MSRKTSHFVAAEMVCQGNGVSMHTLNPHIHWGLTAVRLLMGRMRAISPKAIPEGSVNCLFWA